MITCNRFFGCLVVLLVSTGVLFGASDLDPFPTADTGQVRMVFRLPPATDDTDRKVEIIIGKTLSLDCNQHWYSGQLDSRVVQGWGYRYFVLEQVDGPASTRMACPEGEKREALIPVRGDGFLVTYNSKLPVVVYVPQGFKVHYRVWSAGPEISHAQPE